MAASSPLPTPGAPSASPGRVYFQHLDGLRFWAFFVVMLLHSSTAQGGTWVRTPSFEIVSQIFKAGALGVNFFFVLSGFLITYLLLAEHRQAGCIDVLSFYIRRALRIWPLYFTCVAVAYVLRPGLPNGEGMPPLASFLTFTSNFAVIHYAALPQEQQATFGPIGVLWSVGIEEQFYLAWPLLMSLLLGRVVLPQGKKAGPRGDWFFGIMCAFSLASRIALRDQPAALYYHTLCVIGDMALGGWAAWQAFSRPAWSQRLAGLSRGAIATAYVVLAALIGASTWAAGNMWVQIFSRPALALGFAFIILEQCYASNSFYKCGRSRWLSKLGTYTYGLYCLHLFCLVGVTKLLGKLGLDKSAWHFFFLYVPLALLVSLALAALSYHFFEKPFLRLKRRFAHIQTT